MTKKHRVLELTKLILAQGKTETETVLTCLDCFMTLPGNTIPARRSLLYFTHDIIDYFLERCNRCEFHYPEAADYIKKWRGVWLPRKTTPLDFRLPSQFFATAMWRCDHNFIVTHAAGGGFRLIGLSMTDFVGTNLRAFYDKETEWWAINAMERALLGETVVREKDFRGHRWHYIFTPVVEKGAVIAASVAATLLPRLEEPRFEPFRQNIMPPGPHGHN